MPRSADLMIEQATTEPEARDGRQASDPAQDGNSGLESIAAKLENPAFLLLLLALLTFVLYIGTLSFQYVWDDNAQIVNNPLIRTWKDVPRAFVSDLWFHSTRDQVYYRPLFTTWSTLNYSLFRLNPWGWHLGAVIVHILAVLGVFLLARRLGLDYWTAALSALIFAVHPVHVESVAWISAVSDSMVTFFFALSFVTFIKSRKQDQAHWLAWRIGSLLLLACAVLTKEMGLTLCALVAIYVWLFPQSQEHSRFQVFRQGIIVSLPYGAVTFAYLLLRRFALHQVTGTFDPNHGLADMLRTWPRVLYDYLRILVLPSGLTGFYYNPYVESLTFWGFWLPLFFVIGVALGICYWSRRTGDRSIAFAGLWMIVTLIPVLYLRNFGNGDFVHDRYVYLPSVGFAFLLAKGIRELPGFKRISSHALQVGVTAALTLVYCTTTLSQQVYWANDLLVFKRGYDLYPDSAHASVGYAKELAKRGGYDRAIDLMSQAIKKHPETVPAYFFLAETYTKAGDKADGRAMLEKYLTMLPPEQVSEVSQTDVAGLLGQLGEYDRALAICSKVLARDPDLYSALYDCGNIDLLAGHYPGAESLLLRAIAAAPGQANPNYFLGRVYMQTGRPAEAEAAFRRAIAIAPQIYDYHYWYGRLLAQRGDIPGARREFTTALELNSESAEAKAGLVALDNAR